jgi:hypothetical protein
MIAEEDLKAVAPEAFERPELADAADEPRAPDEAAAP